MVANYIVVLLSLSYPFPYRPSPTLFCIAYSHLSSTLAYLHPSASLTSTSLTSTSLTSTSLTSTSLSYSLTFLQYMFLFQVPWLPELMISGRDYHALGASFVGKKMVSVLCVVWLTAMTFMSAFLYTKLYKYYIDTTSILSEIVLWRTWVTFKVQ